MRTCRAGEGSGSRRRVAQPMEVLVGVEMTRMEDMGKKFVAKV
jgi:hypothetical protein